MKRLKAKSSLDPRHNGSRRRFMDSVNKLRSRSAKYDGGNDTVEDEQGHDYEGDLDADDDNYGDDLDADDDTQI